MTLLFLYILLSLLAFFQLRLAFKAEREYRFPYLTSYRTYLIFFFIYGFIKFVGMVFVLDFFSDRIDEDIVVTQLALLIFPFSALAFYWMLLWTRKLADRAILKSVKVTYWAVQCLIFIYMIINMIVNIQNQNPNWDRLWLTVHIAEWVILLVIVMQLFFVAKEIKLKRKRQFLYSVGWIYLGSFAVFEAFQVLRIPYLSEYSLYHFSVAGGLYFCVNIPALLFLLHFLFHHHHEMVNSSLTEDEMSRFAAAYNITPRENDIIKLILIGKSNKEIGDRLYISLQTVKNINSSIYKKLEVRNRIQLYNRIREFGRADNPAPAD